jgi:hypothetical protein
MQKIKTICIASAKNKIKIALQMLKIKKNCIANSKS